MSINQKLTNMKTRLYIIALFSVVAVLVNAQDWNTHSINDPAIQSQQIIKGGATYDGMVYQPFDNTLPSELVCFCHVIFLAESYSL